MLLCNSPLAIPTDLRILCDFAVNHLVVFAFHGMVKLNVAGADSFPAVSTAITSNLFSPKTP